jgi:CRP-like cAMP-binding protein
MAATPLINYISARIEMSPQEIELLGSYFKCEVFPKNTLLESENTISKKLYFIENGLVRTFYLENGNEITTQIVERNNFITAFDSFVTGQLSKVNVKCITDCEVSYISKEDYSSLYQKISGWERFCKNVYEKTISFNIQRTNDLLSLSAEKKYLKLLSNQPEIIQKVPMQYIASYIGIKPESLSRIRKRIS